MLTHLIGGGFIGTGAEALRKQLGGASRGNRIEKEFMEQLDAYYSHPSSSFYDNKIERKFYEQKLRHLGFKPYPNDGLITFGASGTNKCDREIVFKHGKVKAEKSPDIPFRGRQRRQGTAIIDFVQMDLIHMPKRLGECKFTIGETDEGELAFEDAIQARKVFKVVIPETGEIVKFAITAKPDGIFDYNGGKLLFEYKTKASGITAMNGKLDFKGAESSHLQQVTAESLVFGIDEGILLYESTEKPSWFSDEDNKNVPKTRKTWRDGAPINDLRPFYFKITEGMQQELLLSLARQAKLVYDEELPEITVEMTGKCAFCAYQSHCKSKLSDKETENLRKAEERYGKSRKAGGYEHRNLLNYLEGVAE